MNRIRGLICILLGLIFLMPVIPVTSEKSSEKGIECVVIDYSCDISPVSYSVGDDELDQQQTQTGSGAILCGYWMWAQSFVPTLPVLTRVELLMYKRGNVNDITISIRKYLDGEDLTSLTIDQSKIPSRYEWIEFDFDDINVTPNEMYFIIMSTTGGDNKENYYVLLGSKGDVYMRGDAYIGGNDGKQWEIWGEGTSRAFDFCFKTYGIREEYNEKEPKEKWTYMLYDDADFENAYDPLNDFVVEAWSGKGFNAVVLQDTNSGPAKIWYIDEYHHKQLMKEMGEVNMGDYTTLRDFINYCKQNFPADRYIMDMYNHGGGWRGACIDVTDNDSLTMEEMQKAFEEAGGIDVLMFNAPCLMGNLESVYELRDVVDVYIGSEQLSGYKLGIVNPICELLNHNYEGIDSYGLGEEIVKFVENLGGRYAKYRTISAVRTDKINDLADAVNKLSKDLVLKWPKYYNKIKEAHDNTKVFGRNYADEYQLYDLYGFIQNLLNMGVDSKIQGDIKNLQQIFNETVIAEYHGDFEKGSHGLSIYFPNKFMDGLTIMYGSDSYRLDFPKDTFWNEFLGLYVLSRNIFS